MSKSRQIPCQQCRRVHNVLITPYINLFLLKIKQINRARLLAIDF
jgi:hypothetical protein